MKSNKLEFSNTTHVLLLQDTKQDIDHYYIYNIENDKVCRCSQIDGESYIILHSDTFAPRPKIFKKRFKNSTSNLYIISPNRFSESRNKISDIPRHLGYKIFEHKLKSLNISYKLTIDDYKFIILTIKTLTDQAIFDFYFSEFINPLVSVSKSKEL